MPSLCLLQSDARRIPLASGSVHCVVASPPYWGLRDYQQDNQLGLESVPDCLGWATGALCGSCYVCQMVQVFREVRRVLRADGVCFLNLGDSYNGSGGAGGDYAAGGLKAGQPKYPGRKWLGDSTKLRLRKDLTPDQVAYVLEELAKHSRMASATMDGDE